MNPFDRDLVFHVFSVAHSQAGRAGWLVGWLAGLQDGYKGFGNCHGWLADRLGWVGVSTETMFWPDSGLPILRLAGLAGWLAGWLTGVRVAHFQAGRAGWLAGWLAYRVLLWVVPKASAPFGRGPAGCEAAANHHLFE